MPAAFTIAAKDLKLRFRDRSAIVIGFVAPLVIAVLMSVAFSGTEELHLKLAVVQLDHGELGRALARELRSPELRDVVHVRTVASVAAARRAVRSGTVDVALVVPVDLTSRVTRGSTRPADLRILSSDDERLAASILRSIAGTFVARVNAVRLSVATAIEAGAPPSRLAELTTEAGRATPPEQLVQRPPGSRTLKAVSYYAPAMAIFFLLFAVGFASRGWFVEQADGTLERMASVVHPTSILVGKALAVAIYGAASLGTMVAVTSLALGADWGGVVPATLLGGAMVASVVCLTAFVIRVCRTQRQAEGISSMVAFGLALLGGNFMFVSAAPPIMRRLALLTPNGWALRGFMDLATGPHSVGVIATPLLGIGACCAVVIALTAVSGRRSA